MNKQNLHINETMLQGFEWYLPNDGLHWKRIGDLAPQWRRDGITKVWLPPATKGTEGKKDVGYGVYDPYDLGEFRQKGSVRTKYGTLKQYLDAISRLKAQHIEPLSDMVMNHRLGADRTEKVMARSVNPVNRNEISDDSFEAEVYTGFTFPGRGRKYSSFVWDHRRFSSVDYDCRDTSHHLMLLEDKSFAKDVDDELGNFDYLMGANVDLGDPEVRAEMIRWGEWYLKKTGVQGFRLDAVKHMSAEYVKDWLSALRENSGKPLFTVGEYWSADLEHLRNYLDETGHELTLFDVPLHMRLAEISRHPGEADLRTLFEGTLVGTEPRMAVTFVDNHDTQPGQALESWVDGWFKSMAYSLILLRREGIPCVFYGDLYGIPDSGIGKVSELEMLMKLRSRCAYGRQHDYADEQKVLGFTREGVHQMKESGLACLISIGEAAEKRMYVGRVHRGEVWQSVLGGQDSVTIDSRGWGVFRVNAGQTSVYTTARAARRLKTTFMHRTCDPAEKAQKRVTKAG